jgi:hypothetical protein
MTTWLAIMDETNTRNLLNVLTTSVTPAEYLAGVAVFGLILRHPDMPSLQDRRHFTAAVAKTRAVGTTSVK